MKLSVSVAMQTLGLYSDTGTLLAEYPVSTALNGVGELKNTGQTPRGAHYIRAKIGDGLPDNAVFVGRRFTRELYTPELAESYPGRDWILGRILWLCGREPGKNRLGDVDTMQRYIYIHGTPDTEPMGIPLSHGCIRMRCADVVDLFSKVPSGTPVNILE
ncbi:L,D-transpeptidase [Aliamphritea spongicola]|uniref:L,D-transpeptidase n=1 Tax=Aliamphritea spongicola TaxID=707589 RepID=UPI00196B3329|nr:L,D-transpeptidase [Aliamphritea spongicola]MBN3560599.1 L,D-transpeptidase [Aliamphritea spongicola]